jgi:hypothetical protein
MAKFETKKTTSLDIWSLKTNIRTCDKEELEASVEGRFEDTVDKSVCISKECFSFFVDKNLLCIFGISEINKEIGLPWMIGTDEIERNKYIFIRQSKTEVKKIIAPYKYVFNYVDARNTNSIR